MKSVAAFEQDVTDVASSTNLAQQIPLLENRISGLRSDLDGQSLRQVTKIQCRDRLDAALRQLLSLKNKIISEKVDGILANVIEEAKALESTGVKTAVFVVPMSNDAKVMKRTVDELKKVCNQFYGFFILDCITLIVFAFAFVSTFLVGCAKAFFYLYCVGRCREITSVCIGD